MIKVFAAAVLALVVLDGLWLGVVATEFYRQSLAPIARMSEGRLDPIWPIAALVYPVIALGLTVFVISRGGTTRETVALGALFGAVTFAVYDLTNHSTLRDWRATMTMVDIAWGATSCALAAWFASAVGR